MNEIHHHSSSHEIFHHLLNQTLDTTLNAEERARLEEHLAGCAACRDYGAGLLAFDRRLARSLPGLYEDHRYAIRASDLALGLREQQARTRVFGMGLGLALLVLALAVFFWMGGLRPAPAPASPSLPAATAAPTSDPRTSLPAGRGLVFEAWQDGSPDIFFIRPDGSDRVNLTNHPAWDSLARPSPDGRRMAFASDRSGQTEIYIYDYQAGELSQLTTISGSQAGWAELAWSPDATHIAAVLVSTAGPNAFRIQRGDTFDQARAYDGYQEGELYLVDVATGALQLLSRPGQLAWNPQWLPDGSRVFFNAVEGGYARVYPVRPDSTGLRLVGNPDGTIEQAAFSLSPDGSRLALFELRRSRGSAHPDRLVVLELTGGSSPDALAEFPNYALDLSLAVRMGWVGWSPDGMRLAYVPPVLDGLSQLRLLDPVAGTDILLFSRLDLVLPQQRPAWSADGLQIALLSNGSLYAVSAMPDLPGAGMLPLVKIYESREGFGPGSPAWLPGKVAAPIAMPAQERRVSGSALRGSLPQAALVFQAAPTGDSEILRWTRDNGVTNLTFHSAEDLSPLWSPDGASLFFLSDRSSRLQVYSLKQGSTSPNRVSPAGGPDWLEIADSSPDGNSLLLVGSQPDDPDADKGDLYIVLTNGHPIERLAGVTVPAWSPAFGPYGNLLVYQALGEGLPALFTNYLPGSRVQPAGQGWQVRGYDLSPDRQTVALTTLLPGDERDTWQVEARGLLDPDSLPLIVYQAESGAPGGLVMSPPAWSPDGRQVAFLQQDESGTSLFSVPVTGDALYLLASLDFSAVKLSTSGSLETPAWSPDGNWLAFAAGGKVYLAPSQEDPGHNNQPLRVYAGPLAEESRPRRLVWQPQPAPPRQPAAGVTPSTSWPASVRPACSSAGSYLNLPGVLACRDIAGGVSLDTNRYPEDVLSYYRTALARAGWQESTYAPDGPSPRATWRKEGSLLSIFAFTSASPNLRRPISLDVTSRVEIRVEP